jgi:hypothetical protein
VYVLKREGEKKYIKKRYEKMEKNGLIITSNQRRWCGTDYTVKNVPKDMSDEDVIRACGETPCVFISCFERRGDTVTFNINFD